MLSRDTLLDNRYRIIELLGTGAMGSVYLALDERLSCNVAVKGTIIGRFRLSADEEENLRRAFEREAKLLANLQHEAIPRVSDYFGFEGEQYLVMEYIAGEDLHEQVLNSRDTSESFSVLEVFEWAYQLLDALHYLHTQPEEPVIHKDIKLSNLKVTKRGKIKLLDFGVAKGFAGEMTRVEAGSLQMGTEEYAPLEQFLKFPSKAADTLRQALSIKHAARVEQILHQETDARSDLYSLAVTVYRLLAGKAPADYLPRALAAWEGEPDPIVPLHELNPKVPRAVSEVLMQALALDKENRPASATAMRAALQAAWRKHLREIEEHQGEEEKQPETRPTAEFEKTLAAERARREQAEAALAAREREIAETSARLREITGVLQKQGAAVPVTGVNADRKTNSWLRRISTGKNLLLILLGLVGFVVLLLGLERRESSVKAHTVAEHVARGAEFLKNKDYDRAINEYTEAIRLEPNNLLALTNRADAACQKGDAPRAFAGFDEVLRQNPNYDYLYEKRGLCYETRKMQPEALADYDRAISLDPEDTWTYARRAQIHLLLDNLEKSVADYTQIIRLLPDDWGAHYNRALIYQQLGKKELAAADFKKANELKAANLNGR